MARKTIRNQNQLFKVTLLTLGFLFLFSIGFSQIIQKDKTDSGYNLLKYSDVSFKQIFLSTFNKEKGKLVGDLLNSTEKETGMAAAILKRPINFHNAEAIFETGSDTSYFSTGKYSFFSNNSFTSNWALGGIPIDINIHNQTWSDFRINDLFQASFKFDRDKYLNTLKERLAKKIDPKSIFNSLKNPLEKVLNDARKSLFNEIDDLNNVYKGILSLEIQQIKSNSNLFEIDIKSLRDKFFNQSFLTDLNQKQHLLTIFQQKINNSENIDQEEFSNLQSAVLKEKGLRDLISRMAENQNKWNQSGLLKKIREFELMKKAGMSGLLNDPITITKLARQKLSLNQIQRLFLNINRFNIGSNAFSLSPLSFQHFVSKGINAEFVNHKRTLALIAAKQTDINSVVDIPFTSVFSNNGIVKALSLGSLGTRTNTNFTVSSFSQTIPGLLDHVNPTMFRQVLVTTISNKLSIGEKGFMDVELSRSATQYNHVNSTGDSLLSNKSNLSRIFSTQNFMENTAFSVKYSDENIHQGLSYNINFNKRANGYTNPGNSYLSGGTTEIGMGLKKSLIKTKLLLSFNGKMRVYKYNNRINANWLNNNLRFDIKWKMKKGQYIALRSQSVEMSRRGDGQRTHVTSLQRISIDASLYKRFGKLTYRNSFSFAGQKNKYFLGTNESIKRSTISINSFQNVLVGKRMILVNLNYNHVNNEIQSFYLGSSLYLEVGYSYQIKNILTASSGLIYNSMDNWYRQFGVRQTLSGQLGQNFSVNVYVDLKKNLRVVQPLWNEPVRADISLRYLLLNKKLNIHANKTK